MLHCNPILSHDLIHISTIALSTTAFQCQHIGTILKERLLNRFQPQLMY